MDLIAAKILGLIFESQKKSQNFTLKFFTSRHWLIYFISICFSACKDPENPKQKPLAISKGQMVLVCQEGNFRWGNAEIGLYNRQEKLWEEKAYYQANRKALGDVCQSALFWQDLWWIVVNNSGKIAVLNPESMVQAEQITGFTSPRFMLPVGPAKAYVSDLYARRIWIVSGSPARISGEIPIAHWTEEMLEYKGSIYVYSPNSYYLYQIDPQTDRLTDSIAFPGKLSGMAKAGEKGIWVAYGHEDLVGIALYDPISNARKNWISRGSRLPFALSASTSGDSLFFLSDKPRMLKSTDAQFPAQAIREEWIGNWYGLAYHAFRKELWLSDAKDYVQKSRIICYNLESGDQKEWVGGTNSSRFYFW